MHAWLLSFFAFYPFRDTVNAWNIAPPHTYACECVCVCVCVCEKKLKIIIILGRIWSSLKENEFMLWTFKKSFFAYSNFEISSIENVRAPSLFAHTHNQKVNAFLFHFFPEYKCLTGNISMANWVPQQWCAGTFAFDCRYNHKNRPIFRQFGWSTWNAFISFQWTSTWMVGSDPFQGIGSVYSNYADAEYVPFYSLPVVTFYLGSTWYSATRDELHISCIEDNNYWNMHFSNMHILTSNKHFEKYLTWYCKSW